MEKSKIKELLIKAREGEPESFKGQSYLRAFARLGREKRRDRVSENGIWLGENFYLLEESVADVRKDSPSRRIRYFSSVLAEILPASDIGDGVSAFFETLSDTLDDGEIEGVRSALLAETICLIERTLRDGGEVKDGINTLRRLREFDFSPFFLGFFSYEQYLRRDPARIYPRLDRETKALYKEKIRKYSKKRGLSFTEGCKRLITIAEEKKCHIGDLLPFSRGKRGYFLLFFLFYLALTFLSGSIVFRAFEGAFALTLFLLTLLPLRESAFFVFARVVSLFEKSDILPRLDMPRIKEEDATLAVIATLLTSESEVKETFSHLENLSLKSKSRGKDDGFLYYGVLADFKGGVERRTRSDEKILKTARDELTRLNALYGERFVFFSRERSFDEKSGRWEAKERKRGAINALVSFLTEGKSELTHYGAALPEIKYVLTLDSDTDVELGAVNKMVGTMAHPMNKAVVESRHGVNVVTKGYGILQPTVVTPIESAHATRFSSIVAGVGGIDSYHGAVFNLFHILFGKGVFCGKGIFDVEVYKKTVLDAFPDGIILSHDILEGSRLSAGNLSDITVFDSIPSTARAFYNRAHRWARGDVQSMRFVFPFVPSKEGNARNPMRWEDKFIFVNNIFSLLSPVFSVAGLFLVMWLSGESGTRVALLLLSPFFTPFLSELFSGRLLTASRRFFGDALPALAREIITAWWRVTSLFFLAFKNADAILRSLYRMTVSKKKLLEWTTASAGEREKGSIKKELLYTLPSLIGGVFFLVFSSLPICRLTAIMWCLFPMLSFFFSKKRGSAHESEAHRRIYKKYARDIWRYFEKYVDEANNFLPPDNVSVFPSTETASRTSPTNIGLYLLSVLAALDFGFITPSAAAERLEKSISSVERLPKYKGQLYNWYSTLTLETVGKEYVSTVDSGNFVTALVALYEGLREYEGSDKRIRELRRRIKAIERESDFRFLYNSRRDLFSLGYFPDKEEQDGIVYDTYMSEARTTDYYAIARGIVPESHWSALIRPIRAGKYSVGALSWSGTAFEYFMPQLLLPAYKNSFLHEALIFAFFEQVRSSARVGGQRVYGISESGYFAFDDALNYQYRAFGVPSLSRSRESEGETVISPYSTFLMLRMNPSHALKNLKALERLGMYGECGFYEALDLTPSRVGNTPAVVKSFMCHHLAMSLIALANASFEDIFVSRFLSDREMKAVTELLKESVPTDAISKRREKKRVVMKNSSREREKSEKTFRTAYGTGFLSGRDHTMLLSERGVVGERVKLSGGEYIEAIRPLSVGNSASLFLFATDGDNLFSPSLSDDVSFAFTPAFAEYKTGALSVTVSLSAKTSATRIRFEMTGSSGEVGIYLEPVLRELSAYLSHPAYAGLFFKAEYDESEGALILSSTLGGAHIAVTSTREFTFEVSRERLFGGEGYSLPTLAEAVKKPLSRRVSAGTPVFPCIMAKCSYSSRTDTTFVIGYGRTKAEAIFASRDERVTSHYKSLERSGEFYQGALSAAGIRGSIDRALSEELLSALRHEPRWEIKGKGGRIYTKGALYRLGLSGDNPIFLVKSGTKIEALSKIIRLKKLHYIMGARYDLVIEVADMGYQRGGRRELEATLDREGARFLLEKKGGIFFADISLPDTSEILERAKSGVYPIRESLKTLSKPELYRRTRAVFEGEWGFSENAYVVNCTENAPSLNWSHIIAYQAFGTILSHRSLGTSWAFNSRLGRITYFENDAVGGDFGERVILKKGGVERDLAPSASAVRFTPFGAEYIGEGFLIRVAVHPTLLFKAVSVRVDSDEHILKYKFTPVLDDFPRPTSRVEFASEGKNALTFRNLFSDFFKKGFGYLLLPFEKGITLGEGFAEVHSHKAGETLFVLGYAGSKRHFETVKEYFRENSFDDLVRLSEGTLDFISYQTLVSRFYARSGPYQSGGAWGFRDQAQDCLTVIDIDEKAVRSHIFRLTAHQFTEGDVEHWWHYGRGIRTRCSDDYLWLVWLVCMYIERTNDRSVLGVEVSYLEGDELLIKEKDRYAEHKRSEVKESVASHMRRALDLFLKRGLGEHSLPFIGDGDWNDGMNALPKGTESVWLGFFGRIVIKLYSETIEKREEYIAFSERIREGIESSFYRDRYARLFLPDGKAEGVEESDRIKIDALPQAFSSICHAVTGDGVPSRITLALDTLWRELYDEKSRLMKLFSPPFSAFDGDIGYLSAYPEGIRENGGQYTHAAVWCAIAFLLAPEKKEENRRRAEILIESISPKSRGEEYSVEPYVLAGDVYSSPDLVGHGGWSWYTGAAAWYRKLTQMYKSRNNSAPFT